jgi:REP element-mobilizing transposase RayT
MKSARGIIMPFDPFKHHRHSFRLKGFDYTQPGMYFITIVAYRRLSIFGEIIGGVVRLNACGEIARAEWINTAAIRGEIELDEFVVMPNHFHAIVIIRECDGGSVGARRRRAPTIEQFSKPVAGSIPTIVRAYKSAVTSRINQLRGTSGAPVWQRNYWEHIIRNEEELLRIREYIRFNPVAWEMDDEYPHPH